MSGYQAASPAGAGPMFSCLRGSNMRFARQFSCGLAAALVLIFVSAQFLRAEPNAKGVNKGEASKPSKPKSKSAGDEPSSGGDEKGEAESGKIKIADIPPDEKAEKKALKDLGEGFKLKRTMHYSVFYNTSEDDLKTFSLAIETTYRSCVNYSHKLGVPLHQPKRKLLIYYFQEHSQYSTYSVKLGLGERPQSNPGLYLPTLNISMFYNFQNQDSFKKAREQAEARIADLRKQAATQKDPAARKAIAKQIAEARRQSTHSSTSGGDISESIVQHEVAHQVLWNIGLHNPKEFLCNPRWLAEGTAMMFETISDGKSVNWGALNRSRLEEYQKFLKDKKLIAVREFISTHDHFKEATISIAYAESWALVHYLNRTKRAKLSQYIELINKRPKTYKTTPDQEIADFEKCFGKVDTKWVTAWENWMKRVR
jgi:hypothetical protein